MIIRKIKTKAQSDILSYVLLIVIAISLSVGVYSFMKFYIPKDKEKCADETSISIEGYKCYVSADLRILELQLKNRGLFNIEGFYIRASNTTSTPTTMLRPADVDLGLIVQPGRYDFISPLKPGGTATIRFDYGLEGLEIVKRVQLQPLVKGSKNQTLVCPNLADINLDTCEAPIQAPETPCTPNCGDTSTHCSGTTYSNGCSGGENACIGTKLPDCGARVCGSSPNTCGSCGTCAYPQPICNSSSQCVEESSRNSLIAYYPFDGNANDIIGSYNGIIAGATLRTGKIGQAYNFNGLNNYINTSLTNVLKNFTIGAWIYPHATSAAYNHIISKNSYCAASTTDFPFYLSASLTGTKVICLISDGSGYSVDSTCSISSDDFSAENWHNVYCAYNRSTLNIYVDGIEKSIACNKNLATNSLPYVIGSGPLERGNCGSTKFNGSIDEVRIYNRSLTKTEIMQLYQLT